MSMLELPHIVRERFRSARSAAVLTGAGISAESGVPTFRDAQTGLWARHSPEDLATPGAFSRNPRMVWEWYQWRRQLVLESLPNAGHLAIASLEGRIPGFRVVTQNVDGLHQRAGSRNVVELHGNLFVDRCFREGIALDRVLETDEPPPRCPSCGGPVRPGVIWFGESLSPEVVREAESICRDVEILLVVGTSGLVHPAAGLPAKAKARGAFVIEINPEPTALSELADVCLREKSATALVALLETRL
jgi:NAD-dependent deacetylase